MVVGWVRAAASSMPVQHRCDSIAGLCGFFRRVDQAHDICAEDHVVDSAAVCDPGCKGYQRGIQGPALIPRCDIGPPYAIDAQGDIASVVFPVTEFGAIGLDAELSRFSGKGVSDMQHRLGAVAKRQVAEVLML